jgi:hypothetical protein
VRIAATALVLGFAAGPVFAHGASRGLHLHVVPGAAAPGGRLEIAADAALPIVRLRVAFVGADPLESRPKRPTKRIVVTLTMPHDAKGATASLQAEAETVSGKTLRAAAVVKVAR